jgi:hypothetical protein
VGSAASISQLTVSEKFLEIPVANIAFTEFMKQSAGGVMTEGQRIGYVSG